MVALKKDAPDRQAERQKSGGFCCCRIYTSYLVSFSFLFFFFLLWHRCRLMSPYAIFAPRYLSRCSKISCKAFSARFKFKPFFFSRLRLLGFTNRLLPSTSYTNALRIKKGASAVRQSVEKRK
ncbi:hypothetical protein K445DRAFT_144313 [Daldinia sp. EC12]|nr:hypothetical protein F4774DRAFT_404431 [Daldinia eschscholtzii]OTB14026.1 hypothetical protein K445DRAFT_144313 [Daldinia sp. EC12]